MKKSQILLNAIVLVSFLWACSQENIKIDSSDPKKTENSSSAPSNTGFLPSTLEHTPPTVDVSHTEKQEQIKTEIEIEIETLKESIKSLNQEKTKLEEFLTQQKTQIEELKKIKPNIENLTTDFNKKAENAKLSTASLESLKKENENHLKELKKLTEDKTKLIESIETNNKEIIILKKKNKDDTEFTELEKNITNLKASIENLEAKNKSLTQKKSDFENENQNLEETKKNVTTNNKSLEEKVTLLTEESKTKQQNLETLQKKIDDLKNENKKLKENNQNSTQKIKKSNQENHKLQETLTKIQTESTSLSNEESELELSIKEKNYTSQSIKPKIEEPSNTLEYFSQEVLKTYSPYLSPEMAEFIHKSCKDLLKKKITITVDKKIVEIPAMREDQYIFPKLIYNFSTKDFEEEKAITDQTLRKQIIKNLTKQIINEKNNLLLVIKLKDYKESEKMIKGTVLCGFTRAKFKSIKTFDNENAQLNLHKDSGILLSITQDSKSTYQYKKYDKKIKISVVYDDFFLIFGNSELRIREGETDLFSNAGVSNQYYNAKSIEDFVGKEYYNSNYNYGALIPLKEEIEKKINGSNQNISTLELNITKDTEQLNKGFEHYLAQINNNTNLSTDAKDQKIKNLSNQWGNTEQAAKGNTLKMESERAQLNSLNNMLCSITTYMQNPQNLTDDFIGQTKDHLNFTIPSIRNFPIESYQIYQLELHDNKDFNA